MHIEALLHNPGTWKLISKSQETTPIGSMIGVRPKSKPTRLSVPHDGDNLTRCSRDNTPAEFRGHFTKNFGDTLPNRTAGFALKSGGLKPKQQHDWYDVPGTMRSLISRSTMSTARACQKYRPKIPAKNTGSQQRIVRFEQCRVTHIMN